MNEHVKDESPYLDSSVRSVDEYAGDGKRAVNCETTPVHTVVHKTPDLKYGDIVD